MEIENDSDILEKSTALKQSPAKESVSKNLLKDDNLNFFELIQIENLQECISQLDAKETQNLFKQQQVIKQFIDCALRPHVLQGKEIKIEWPFRAVEFLTHQQEEFYKAFFVKGFDNSQQAEVNSSFQMKVQGSQLLNYIFKILEQPSPLNETSAGYFLRIFNQIYYQNQQECFYFFTKTPSLLSKCINHFYNSSIQQLLWRVIDTYNEDIDSKTYLMNMIFQGVMTKRPHLAQCLQNLDLMISDLLQRCEQINTKKTSTLFTHKIISTVNVELMRELIKHIQDRDILKYLSSICCSFALFYLPKKPKKKTTFYMDDSFEIESISQQLTKEIVAFTQQIQTCWFEQYPSKNQKQSKYYAVRLLHLIIKLIPKSLEVLIGQNFLHILESIFKLEPHNNIVHNEIKGVINLIIENQSVSQITINKLIKFILISYNIPKQQSPTFLNQLYYIASLLNQKINTDQIDIQLKEKWVKFLDGQFKNKKQVYESEWSKGKTSPKKSFDIDEEVISEDSTGEIVTIKKYSQQIDLASIEPKIQYSPTIGVQQVFKN